MKEGQDKFQSKKVNQLTLEEALDMKHFLEKCDQQTSKKYQHVMGRIETLVERERDAV